MEYTTSYWDNLKASFGFIPGLGLLAGLLLGVGLPYVDQTLGIELPVIEFASTDAARSLLGTIGTVTVSVAGLAFSVTLVALTLASAQLSPRVLRTFQTDRLSQTLLASLLGTFIFCIVVLLRLGGSGGGASVPDLSLTVAVVAAFASFAMFAWFIHHIVSSLQPSTLIRRIVADIDAALDQRYPHGIGRAPDSPEDARRLVADRKLARAPRPVQSDDDGYLTQVRGEAIIAMARRHDALVRQRVAPGDYVLPGDVLAELWCDEDDGDDHALVDELRGHFVLGRQRTPLQDVAFPVRQLADIALKGVSPGINDPTTAENAMDALAASLVRFARAEQPASVRLDADGTPRFIALAPTLDDMVRLGFAQVRIFSVSYPVLTIRLLELLQGIGRAALAAGLDAPEVDRQAALLREGTVGSAPTEDDGQRVAAAHDRLHGGGPPGAG
jgi:uncharacterized membrane protein